MFEEKNQIITASKRQLLKHFGVKSPKHAL